MTQLQQHEKAIKLIEAIHSFKIRRKVATENVKLYAHFPRLRQSEANRVDTINRCIVRLKMRYEKQLELIWEGRSKLGSNEKLERLLNLRR